MSCFPYFASQFSKRPHLSATRGGHRPHRAPERRRRHPPARVWPRVTHGGASHGRLQGPEPHRAFIRTTFFKRGKKPNQTTTQSRGREGEEAACPPPAAPRPAAAAEQGISRPGSLPRSRCPPAGGCPSRGRSCSGGSGERGSPPGSLPAGGGRGRGLPRGPAASRREAGSAGGARRVGPAFSLWREKY